MQDPGEQLHDIDDPAPHLPGIDVPLWFWIAAGVIAVAAVAALVFFVAVRRHRATPPPVVSVFEEARRALEVLRERLPGQPLATVATDASLVLRHYLAETLQEPALYETHEEFLARSDALQQLPAGARERLAPLLEQLAASKYGPSTQNDEAASALVDKCLEVLQGVESTRERQVA